MEKILEQYGRVTVYMEANHPSPMYHVDGGVDDGDVTAFLRLFDR